MLPEISVIVPVYKVEPFLKECIDSIILQNYTNFELIFIDDGSPDKCGEICDSYAKKDARIKVIHQNNQGLSAARNAGLDIAIGQFLTFIDSDDIIEVDYLEKMLQLIYQYEADVVVCNHYIIDQSKKKRFKEAADCKTVIMDNIEAVLSLYDSNEDRLPIMAWGKLFKKEITNEIRFPVGKMHEDQFTIPILLYEASKVVWTKKKLYGYRKREGSIMHKPFSLKRYDDIEAVEQCAKYFNKKQEIEIVKAAEKKRKELISYYSLLARKAGFYHNLSKDYKVGRYRALRTLKKNLPYNIYSYRVAQVYPRYIFIEAHIRRALQLIGLKIKN